MKEGDLITTYYSGYFRLDKIKRRFYTADDIQRYPSLNAVEGQEYGSLMYFTQVYDANGSPKKGKQKACDIVYCKSAEESIKQEIEKIERKKENLLKILL